MEVTFSKIKHRRSVPEGDRGQWSGKPDQAPHIRTRFPTPRPLLRNRVQHLEVSRGAGLPPSLSAVPPGAKQRFRSLLTAIVATETCAIRHELRAGLEAGDTAKPAAAAPGAAAAGVSRGTASTSPAPAPAARGAAGGGGKKKRVRFCAFDLSTVDMPSDAIKDSDVAGELLKTENINGARCGVSAVF